MRTYGQYCSIARALDVVGDRWTLLIARELLLQGRCRFTDLKNGLPGIATNLLSTRLKELEDAGLISREDAPPPVATVLYSLTENGLALEPVLKALGLWGLRHMTVERPGDEFQARWLAYAPAWFTTDTDPDAPPVTIQLVASDKQAVIEVGQGQVRSRVGRADNPDLILDGPPRAILGLLAGVIDIDLATSIGLTVHGRRDLLTRLQPIDEQPAHTQPEAVEH
ncbi:helix-turn-helix domain-containing protein [Pseudofrankia sp. BMG5.36]|uniref:winged helix-turn-helix transcriptional regulator n=1 Tax=Pseudofrankia sp. BMG5.36 TaxID=1834512 RepID=UPI0008DAF701|nr:helix-turn-helix domain-containing protein [Pseudofrankia sp. BMG5.36]OHV67515.1 MarR family transcriptional regulator [Pseudofrankia sp. BMG5.36]